MSDTKLSDIVDRWQDMLYFWVNTGQFEHAIYKAFEISSDNKDLQGFLSKIRAKDFLCLPSISLNSLNIMDRGTRKSIYEEETNSFYLDEIWSQNVDNSILMAELSYNLGHYMAKLLIGDDDDYSAAAMKFSNALVPSHLLINRKPQRSVKVNVPNNNVIGITVFYKVGILLAVFILSIGIYEANNWVNPKKEKKIKQEPEINRAELIVQTGMPFYANASSFLQYFNSRNWDDGIKRQFSNVGDCQKYTYSTTIEFHCRGGYVKEFTPAGESVCRLARMRYERSIDTGRERFIWINPEDEDGDERRDCNYL